MVKFSWEAKVIWPFSGMHENMQTFHYGFITGSVVREGHTHSVTILVDGVRILTLHSKIDPHKTIFIRSSWGYSTLPIPIASLGKMSVCCLFITPHDTLLCFTFICGNLHAYCEYCGEFYPLGEFWSPLDWFLSKSQCFPSKVTKIMT